MEVILKEDVPKLGSRGDVVKVAEGYGRNFLLPKKLAIEATNANKAVIVQMKEAAVPEPHTDVPATTGRESATVVVVAGGCIYIAAMVVRFQDNVDDTGDRIAAVLRRRAIP